MGILIRVAGSFALAAYALIASAQVSGTESLTVTVSEVDFAASGTSQTDPALIQWQPYDTFAGAALNTSLWQIGNQLGSLSTGATGLVLTPTALTSANQFSTVAIQTPVPVPLGQYFAVRVPITVNSAAAGLPGVAEFDFDICGANLKGQCDVTGWALGNQVIPPGGGPIVNGMRWFAGPTPLALMTTASTQGQLAVIFSGGALTSYVNEGTGWVALGAPFTPPASWEPAGGPYTFSLGDSVTTLPAVPEPSSLVLVGLGLCLLLLFRLRERRSL